MIPVKPLIEITLEARRIVRNWPTFLLQNRVIPEERIMYHLRSGVGFSTRKQSSDFQTILDVWSRKTYTPAGFELHSDDVVLDVGAHIGVFSVFASVLAQKGKVYAFEPMSDNFGMLKHNLSINGIKNVDASKEAIAGYVGTRELFLSDSDLGHSLYPEVARTRIADKEVVSAVSLNEVVVRDNIDRIDFLKMNCEGAEYEILQNSSDNTLRIIEKMAIQYHDIDERMNVTFLRRFLEEKGYDVSLAPPGSYRVLFAGKKR